MELDGRVIRETLAGYARASEEVARERRERLATITPEQSLAIYEDLVNTWVAANPAYRDVPLTEWSIEATIRVRRVLDRLAEKSRSS